MSKNKGKEIALAFVILWLVAYAAGVYAQIATDFSVPLMQLVIFAGVVSAVHVGIDGAGHIMRSRKMPKDIGDSDSDVPLWIVVVWSVLMIGTIGVQGVFSQAQFPVAEAVAFAGLLTAEYVASVEGNGMARESEGDK